MQQGGERLNECLSPRLSRVLPFSTSPSQLCPSSRLCAVHAYIYDSTSLGKGDLSESKLLRRMLIRGAGSVLVVMVVMVRH